MELKVVKIINENAKYKAKDGKEYSRTNYYVCVNGNFICIRPAFAKDYGKLDLFCEVIRNGKSE